MVQILVDETTISSVRSNVITSELEYGPDFSPEEEHLILGLVDFRSQSLAEDSYSDFSSDEERLVQELVDDLSPRCHVPIEIKQKKLQTGHNINESGVGSSKNALEHSKPVTRVVLPSKRRRSQTCRSLASKPSSDKDEQEQDQEDDDQEDLVTTSTSPRKNDAKSPLQRFRRPPEKSLSVTDLASPSWCELQYWYALTKFGKPRRTKAMKKGSSIHEKLEKQVHKIVPIVVESREDVLGLRIWNIIEGLRNLKESGIARELGVWGVVDGCLVTGVIDKLSYACPDTALESSRSPKHRKERGKIYLTDVKTRQRGNSTVPRGSSLRPMQIQLMLYRKFLSALASSSFSPNLVFERFKVDTLAPFTDEFIAEIASLHATPKSTPSTTTDALDEILQHNSVSQLWELMQQQFSDTFPHGSDSIGMVLEAEYRSQVDGSVLGSRTFLYDETDLDAYVHDEMKWWRGKREARGVEIEDAFKCQTCDFAADCQWRRSKVIEIAEKQRLRRNGVPKSSV